MKLVIEDVDILVPDAESAVTLASACASSLLRLREGMPEMRNMLSFTCRADRGVRTTGAASSSRLRRYRTSACWRSDQVKTNVEDLVKILFARNKFNNLEHASKVMHGITMAANGARELVATAGKAGMKAARWCGPGSCSSRGGGGRRHWMGSWLNPVRGTGREGKAAWDGRT